MTTKTTPANEPETAEEMFGEFSPAMRLRAGRGQKILTAAELKRLPPLYANESKPIGAAVAHAKLFNPMGSDTWYLTELNAETGEAFGLVVNQYTGKGGELGYVYLPELAAITLRFGMGIERDIHWKPQTLAEITDGFYPATEAEAANGGADHAAAKFAEAEAAEAEAEAVAIFEADDATVAATLGTDGENLGPETMSYDLAADIAATEHEAATPRTYADGWDEIFGGK